MSNSAGDPIKLLVLTTSYPIARNSISGIFVKRLAEALHQRCQVAVLAPAGSGESVAQTPVLNMFRYAPHRYQVLAHGAGGIPVQLKLKPWMVLWLPFFLGAFLFSAWRHAGRADLLQANWAISGVIAVCVGKLRKKPVVTTLRGADVNPGGGALNKLLLSWAVRYSDAVVAVSDDMQARLGSIYPTLSGKVTVIHNGVDPEFLSRPCAASALDSTNDKPRIIFVGSLIQRKNVELLLHAIAWLQQEGWEPVCTLVGDGPESAHLRQVAEDLKIASRVRFVGQKTPLEVADLLAGHTIYISASLQEGRPNSVIEAMAAGCCCLLSDIAGHRELVREGNNALLFNPEQASSLSAVIKRVLSSPQLRSALGHSARRYITDNALTWDGCASKYETLFANVLDPVRLAKA
ncbi:MAG: glycosyltransferase family 4 protein [Gammaproteobacteria bacterium]|nr:glycosyltransferase family 4 protein [Gammaproteobacteria bacterium]